jgi:Ca-activated chloride channel family protein
MKMNPIFTVLLTLSSSVYLAGCVSSVDQSQSASKETTSDIKGSGHAPVMHDQEVDVVSKSISDTASKAKREASIAAVQKSRSYQMAAPAQHHKSMPQAERKLHAAQVMSSGAMSSGAMPSELMPIQEQSMAGERYAKQSLNPVKRVAEHPVSTFSIDVDTGSYSNVRRILNQGGLPPKHAVRVEEMINYFDYQYASPESSDLPFSINTELALAPWSDDHLLLSVGLQGFEPAQHERPAANLVFLMDVSGSMSSPNKLPLLKKSLLMLSRQLTAEDKVSIVVYAGASGVVLEPTDGNQVAKIEQVLDTLNAGGSTNGQSGIQLAYNMAEQSFITDGINRVILATDGDFNVGLSNVDALKALIEKKRKKGISLTTLGFGRGNYNDHLMEQLADVGNGNYAYIDTLHEARKVLVEELSSTLLTIAKDVKIQLEFNPEWVAEYRLLGYENRMLAREDFNNDQVDAGEIGAGHSVTALYELSLINSEGQRIEPLRYQSKKAVARRNDQSNELAFLKLRYKKPKATKSQLLKQRVIYSGEPLSFDDASEDFRFSATVAGFGQKLQESKYLGDFGYSELIDHALSAKGSDEFGYRQEMIQLMRLAQSLDH